MSNKPLISVIVPVYKVERYLDQCVQSIIDQDYHNLDVILIDDGSPDRCPQMCDAWAEHDPRIRVIHKPNGGLSDARNRGLAEARGEFVLFVDSDDWIDRSLISAAVSCSLQHDAQVVLFGYRIVSETNEVMDDTLAQRLQSGEYSSLSLLEALWTEKVASYAWAYLFRRDLVEHIVFPKGRVMEDLATTYKIWARASQAYYLNKAYYNYRFRNDSIMSSKTPKAVNAYAQGIAEMDAFAAKHFPELRQCEIHWSIKNRVTTLIWAYEAKEHYSNEEYRDFCSRQKGIIRQLVRSIGFMNCNDMLKGELIVMNLGLMNILALASLHRNKRK